MFSLTKWVLHKIWEVMKLSPWIQVAVSPPASDTSLSQSSMSKSSWGDFKWGTFVPPKSFQETKNFFVRNFRFVFHKWIFAETGSGACQCVEKPCLISCRVQSGIKPWHLHDVQTARYFEKVWSVLQAQLMCLYIGCCKSNTAMIVFKIRNSAHIYSWRWKQPCHDISSRKSQLRGHFPSWSWVRNEFPE